MESGPIKDLVVQLRAIRSELNLSISDILSMLKEQGTPLSESTVRRVLDQDIENISGFSYEATLMPLCDLLLPKGDTNDSALSASRIESLLAIIEIKNEEIHNLQETKKKYESDQKKSEEQQAIRCKRCEENVAFLKKQIALKDARMDKKDEWIDRLLGHMEEILHEKKTIVRLKENKNEIRYLRHIPSLSSLYASCDCCTADCHHCEDVKEK